MTHYQILNNVDHKDIRVTQAPGEAYGDRIHCCPAYTFEFRDLQADFPILLQNSQENGLIPVALMGFEQGENLFLGDGSWSALSRPAFLQRGPFLIGQHKVEGSEEVRVLSIDADHPRVGTQEGEALFQPLGGRTEYLERMADLMERIHESAEHTKRFTQTLSDYGVVEPVTMDITLRDGSKNQLIGFHALKEEKVRELNGEQLAALADAGFLMPLFMMLASLPNLRRLIELKEQARAGQQ